MLTPMFSWPTEEQRMDQHQPTVQAGGSLVQGMPFRLMTALVPFREHPHPTQTNEFPGLCQELF